MTFLKKLGQILLKATEIVAGFQPLIASTFPGVSGPVQVASRDLAQIADIIAQVEAMGQALGQPGADKLRAAAPLVAQVILQSSLLAQRQIADPMLFKVGAQKVADGMADVLNSLKDDISTSSKV
jgi:hypothetical protein